MKTNETKDSIKAEAAIAFMNYMHDSKNKIWAKSKEVAALEEAIKKLRSDIQHEANQLQTWREHLEKMTDTPTIPGTFRASLEESTRR